MGCLMQVFWRKIVMLSRAISWHITGTLWVSVYTKSWWISQWPVGSGGSYSEATSIQEIVIPLWHVMMARLWSQDGIEWFLYGKGKIIHQYTQPKFSKVTSLYLYFSEVDRGVYQFHFLLSVCIHSNLLSNLYVQYTFPTDDYHKLNLFIDIRIFGCHSARLKYRYCLQDAAVLHEAICLFSQTNKPSIPHLFIYEFCVMI